VSTSLRPHRSTIQVRVGAAIHRCRNLTRGLLRSVRRRFRRTPRVLAASRRPSEPGALLSYLAAPLGYPARDRRLFGHTNAWECRAIADRIAREGYVLDAIDWSDDKFQPSREYELIFDLHRNLERLAPWARTRWLHITGSHPRFAHEAELSRLASLEERRGIRLAPRRAFDTEDTERFDRSLEMADTITILGDDITRSTYPSAAMIKSEQVFVTASPVPPRQRDDDFEDRTFLWFAGAGAVHKGLDLVLECFARNPDLTLHCVGPYEQELDFVAAFGRELYRMPNIVSHGWLLPADPTFQRIARQASSFVMPSCSESMSTAAATCMQFGLVPIVTARCGLQLPAGTGRVLDDDVTDLDAAVLGVANTPRECIAAQIGAVKSLAAVRHSRATFESRINELVARYAPGQRNV
jgi:hypothetical protein